MAVPRTEEKYAYDGLANLANSIRRSMAAYVAMQLTPPNGTMEQWEDNFDKVAAKIRGHAADEEAPKKPPLGQPWPPTD